jgi:multiple sugar transport system substrate-binding protein
MKYIFLSILAILVMASIATSWYGRKNVVGKPVIYWVTDNNPARDLQIKNFGSWMKKNNYADVELRLDTANADISKKIIQSVSGVGGDVMDISPGYGALLYFNEIGLVEDVTAAAEKLDFDTSKTYPSLADDLTIGGRQYLFPCNVSAPLFFVNLGIFEKVGVKPPPMRWSIEEFERIGREFAEVANRGLDHRQYFLANTIEIIPLVRSLGADLFNETLTRSNVASNGYAKAFALIRKWMFEDHIVPTTADIESFSTGSGYGGAMFQLFYNGNYAMVSSGRYALIQFREFGNMKLDAVEYPNAGYPNTTIYARAACVYKGGKHKDLAEYFLAYLASEDYNMNIVEDGDSLPPNPKYTLTEEYLHPKKYPNEWEVHSKFAQDAVDISITISKSPFVSNNRAYTFHEDCKQTVISNVYTPEEAAKILEERVNDEISRTLAENPKLKPEYERRVAIQKKIDEYRKDGSKIPKEWISNPFHKKYYRDMGWLE